MCMASRCVRGLPAQTRRQMTTQISLPAPAGPSSWLVVPHAAVRRSGWSALQALSGRRLIIVMAVLMAMLVIGVTLTAYFSVRERVQRKWADQLSTMSLMMAEQASQTMFSAHTVLDSIDSQISATHVDNEDAYRRLAGTKEMHELLVSRTASNPNQTHTRPKPVGVKPHR